MGDPIPSSSSSSPTDPTLLTHHFHVNLNFNENQDKDIDGEVDHENLKDDSDNNETAHEENADGWRCRDDAGDGNSSSCKVEEDMHQQQQQQLRYPLRPGAEDCNFYLRMGTCKFGFTCKFNHPSRTTANQAINLKPRMKEREDHSERPIQTECKYYLSAGGCKYGKACRFNHFRERSVGAPILEYNFLGLPIRMGEKDCSYYMRNGSCKYGANCRFNHPDPTVVSDTPSGFSNGNQAPSWSTPMPLKEAVPFLPESYASARGAHSQGSKWNQGPVFSQENNIHPSPAFGSNIHPMAQSAFSHFQPQLAVEEFPERPGQPECTYFIKTGDCKFRSGCKFHHPKDRIVQPSCAMTEKGLPLRPGQIICTHYSNYGICKFGPNCRYDHPPNIQHMAPSIMTGLDRLDRVQHPSTNFASPGDTPGLCSPGEAL